MNSNEQTKRNTTKTSMQGALIGALYGFLMGTTFVLVAAWIDIWLHAELPIGVDWNQVLLRWALIGLGITLIGGLTGLFPETFHGLLAGTIAAGLIALVTALFLSGVSTGMKFMVLIFTLVPIAVMCLPLVILLRFLARQHALALQKNSSGLRVAVLIVAAVAVGVLGGYFMKMPARALASLQIIHKNVQAAPEEQDKQVRQIPGLQEHVGMRYELFQKSSAVSTEGTDVRVLYEDGYAIQCVVVSYPGREPYIRSCEQTK